jgi:hypothetical protein
LDYNWAVQFQIWFAVLFSIQNLKSKSKIDMMLYVLICLCLALSGVAGLQFFYLFYLERIDDERKKRLRELEHHAVNLTHRLEEAEQRLAAQEKIINDFYQEPEEDEAWADLIEEP